MEYSTHKRLCMEELEGFLPKGSRILFLGPGWKPGLNVLLSAHYDVLNVDFCDKPSETDLNWLKSDVLDLDFEKLKDEYDIVILHRLCDKELHASMPWHLLSNGRITYFDKVIIEFCDNEEHYDFKLEGKALSQDKESMNFNALKCEELLQACDYNTKLINSNHEDMYRLRIFASREDLPVLHKPEIPTGFPQGVDFGPWDGNYYD